MAQVKNLLGKTLIGVDVSSDMESIIFTTNRGEKYKMWHRCDCCETVTIESIVGDVNDLIGSPILLAEEATNNQNPPDSKKECSKESFTWTFYKFATIKGYVDIRWYGESNGYYSERVDFDKIYKTVDFNKKFR